MPHNCPHCAKELDGFVSQETMRERLEAKDTRITTLQADLRDATAAKTKLETDSADWRKSHDELLKVRARQAEDQAFADAGLDVKLDRHRDYIRALYTEAHADVAEDARPQLGEWLKSYMGSEEADPWVVGLKGQQASSEGAPAGDGGNVKPSTRIARPTPPPIDRGTGDAPPPKAATATQTLEAINAALRGGVDPSKGFGDLQVVPGS